MGGWYSRHLLFFRTKESWIMEIRAPGRQCTYEELSDGRCFACPAEGGTLIGLRLPAAPDGQLLEFLRLSNQGNPSPAVEDLQFLASPWVYDLPGAVLIPRLDRMTNMMPEGVGALSILGATFAMRAAAGRRGGFRMIDLGSGSIVERGQVWVTEWQIVFPNPVDPRSSQTIVQFPYTADSADALRHRS